MTFGSLFAGVGGFDLGLERAGMTCRWQVEIDPFCRRVLEKYWPHVARFDDVRTVTGCDVVSFGSAVPCGDARDYCRNAGSGQQHATSHRLSTVDVICGGFPCQDISYAGLGVGIGGERSGLWSEFARIVGELRPGYVLVENVPALLVRGLGRVLGDLATLGYDAEWDCVSAEDIGAAQTRDRVWVVAYSQGRYGLTDCSILGRQEPSGMGTWWASEPGVVRVADGVPNRTHRCRAIGNAIVPQIAEWIGRRIMEAAA
jgi:DNA (cytosine-5)-methyltransferase 1